MPGRGCRIRTRCGGRVDVVHLHFGFEHLDADDLGGVGRAPSARRDRARAHRPRPRQPAPRRPARPPRSRRRAGRCGRRGDDADAVGGRRARRRTGAAPSSSPTRTSCRSATSPTAPAPARPRGGVYVHAATLRPNLDVELRRAGCAAPPAASAACRVHVRPARSPDATPAACDAGWRASPRSRVDLDVGPRLDDASCGTASPAPSSCSCRTGGGRTPGCWRRPTTSARRSSPRPSAATATRGRSTYRRRRDLPAVALAAAVARPTRPSTDGVSGSDAARPTPIAELYARVAGPAWTGLRR